MVRPRRLLGDSALCRMPPSQGSPFDGWNKLIVPYCSQDLHSGTAATPTNATWGLAFAGHLTYGAVLDAMTTSHGMAAATDIVISGESAGGIGTWINAGATADRFPAARVSVAPIAGHYFTAYPYEGPNHGSSALANFTASGLA